MIVPITNSYSFWCKLHRFFSTTNGGADYIPLFWSKLNTLFSTTCRSANYIYLFWCKLRIPHLLHWYFYQQYLLFFLFFGILIHEYVLNNAEHKLSYKIFYLSIKNSYSTGAEKETIIKKKKIRWRIIYSIYFNYQITLKVSKGKLSWKCTFKTVHYCIIFSVYKLNHLQTWLKTPRSKLYNNCIKHLLIKVFF